MCSVVRKLLALLVAPVSESRFHLLQVCNILGERSQENTEELHIAEHPIRLLSIRKHKSTPSDSITLLVLLSIRLSRTVVEHSEKSAR